MFVLFQSTGDSLDEEDDDEEKCLTEAKKNTAYNEVIDADNPQTPSEVKKLAMGHYRIWEGKCLIKVKKKNIA